MVTAMLCLNGCPNKEEGYSLNSAEGIQEDSRQRTEKTKSCFGVGGA